MDFISSLFSFIPLLMIILFIVRFVAGVGKRKKPRPLNTIQPGTVSAPKPKKRDPDDRKNAAGIQPAETEQKPDQTVEPAPESAQTFEPEQTQAPEDVPERDYRTEPVGKLFKQREEPPLDVTTYSKSAQTESKLNRLSELKKAVVWAEILGKPKGLE